MNAKVYFKLFLAVLLITAILNSTFPVYASTATVVGAGREGKSEEDAEQEVRQLFLNLAGQVGYSVADYHNNPDLQGLYYQVFREQFSIVFCSSHGDRDTEYGKAMHWFFWQTNDLKVYDDQIYSQSKFGNISFVFMWTCHSADFIGCIDKYPDGTIVEQGLPAAWLHLYSYNCAEELSEDGYINIFPSVGRFCVIGFQGVGPCLTAELDGIEDAGFKFMKAFWQAAFDGRHTIKLALDYASKMTFGPDVPFGKCIFYKGFDIGIESGRMRVYGNTEIQLVHIYDFNCDCKVDGKDVRRAAKAFGAKAYGGFASDNWDPVVDVIPNHRVDGGDIREVRLHFGEHYQ